MPSIIDKIAETEQRAEEIKNDAVNEARKIVEQAQSESELAIESARREAKALMQQRRDSAVHSAKALVRDIIAKRKAEDQSHAIHARGHLDKAVSYIIERIEN